MNEKENAEKLVIENLVKENAELKRQIDFTINFIITLVLICMLSLIFYITSKNQ